MKNLQFNYKRESKKKVTIVLGRFVHKDVNILLQKINPDKVFVVSDNNVTKLYGRSVLNLISPKYPAYLISHPPLEKGKNLRSLVGIIKEYFANGGNSKSCILALGGGVTGNIAGFASSMIYRGITLIHMPTTLLAQLDSAPDVKQSINAPGVKNALGSYKAPDLVIIDPFFLKSLSSRDISSGIAEAVKHGFSQDIKFVEYIVQSLQNNNLDDLDVLEKIISKTITLKIKHWKETPSKWNETKKIERLTHLGHTTGKILEMVDLDHLTHGEAISHGMLIEFYISYLLGYLDIEAIEYAQEVFQKLNLLYPLNKEYTADRIVEHLYSKYSKDKPIFALLKGLGNSDTLSTTVPKKTFIKALNWYLKTKHK